MTEQLHRLRTALGDRYSISGELGRGGTATVYRAQDLKHQRRVAVKVMRPELAASLGAERFLREIQIAARLSHPHILPLYDSGEVHGLLYYVMPYVGGESLRNRLIREKQLPLEEALHITLEVADALGYAHGCGVVHRDIKPGNIMLESGHALVTDFGIARAITAAGDDQVTTEGIAVGTPAYMSPEQAGGEQQLDARSDIYALGCVLYEMLAGEPPYKGLNPQAILARKLAEPVPSLRAVRDTVSTTLERVIFRALARAPTDRFATTAEFAQALGSGRALSTPSGPIPVTAPTAPPAQSIAVLPFVNMSPDPENEYFSDGVAEEIINALNQHGEFHVAARTSCFAFKGKSASIAEVGTRLNVATVLEGSVRKAGTRLRITTQLINVADGYHLWSERYDREMKDVFAIQDEIARAIVEALRGRLGGEKRPPRVKRYTENVAAYELYLKGRYVENTRTRVGFSKGIEYFEQAIAEDPGYALAYAGLADTYSLLAWYRHLPPAEAFPRAHSAASKALEIDEALAEAHTSEAVVRFYYDWDWHGAELCFTRALELSPNHPTALHSYAEYLAARGRLDDALEMVSQAREVDPLSLTINAGLGWVHYFGRRYDEALQRFEQTLALDPDYVFLHWFLGQAYMMKEMWEDAISVLRRGMVSSGGHPGMAAYLGHACARSGNRDEALRLRGELEERAVHGYVPADYMGVVCMGLGQVDEAFEWLEKACDERALHMVFLGVDPLYDCVRSDSRFAALLGKIGLEGV
ncbi:MAG: protein kinase [Gemmatimonadales bacterium]|nr:protein kinase [Gemmatimonadales bacterium]NIN11910.1 protein kinase [Gemmatimonadales bacterium]NIN50460.1 protein kinase [Gemmatimonadales bacterium]NIP07924.1 protein kinase [Gemmatimonadales bacterium]NIR01948.1 protein kinase [Gemmatimonadales bacterium]